MKRMGALLLALVCLLASRALAETRVWVFAWDDPPAELAATSALVTEGETHITLTFAGDCVLGNEARLNGSNSFRARIQKEGMAYPFEALQPLFATDDFTVANLECVFSDSKAGKVSKTYNFRGPTEYTQILTLGDIECVGLANNHSLDFGQRGKLATEKALDAAGIGRFDEDTLCVLEKDGVRIGLTGTLYSLSESKQQKLALQMQTLRELGCAAIVHVMHAGVEYSRRANGRQAGIAERAIGSGASLVLGHHPHVPQNAELVSGVPVVYSLGNCSFGGNLDPSVTTALLLRAEFSFDGGALDRLDWSLYPISITGKRASNDFQPCLLTGEAAQAVIDRMQDTSALTLQPYREGLGAVQQTVYYQRQEE